MRLADKVALVTGGGSGLGRGIARRFAGEGAFVAVLDVNESGAAETVGSIEKDGGTALALRADVSAGADVRQTVETVAARWGRLDVLCNCAGILLSQAGDTLVTEMDEAVWDRVLAVNLKSVFLCCKYGIPVMSDGGSIVNIASIAALVGRGSAQAYIASKGGVVALTRSLAVQFAPRRIRANAILPGRADTPMVAAAFHAPDERQGFVPLGRLGTPDDIANLALYLASDESSWVTGGMYVIDGGLTAV